MDGDLVFWDPVAITSLTKKYPVTTQHNQLFLRRSCGKKDLKKLVKTHLNFKIGELNFHKYYHY